MEANKKEMIKSLVIDMINESSERLKEKLENVLNSGCIDVEGWDINNGKMVLPKTIVTALLESEAHNYNGSGTKYEKQIKKEVKNIRNFL